jgi:DNA-binding response OmpR family regulator
MASAARILVVDDEPFNVSLLEQELELLGYETEAAENGAVALEMVRRNPPDLIVLDVMMPVMDGFELCRILKEDEETRLIPIVIMTALDAFNDRITGIEAGADDFLTKPVNDRELKARITTALRLKATVDAKIKRLDRIKEHYAKFVPEAVKGLVDADPEHPDLAKRERDISVLFVDISGYGRLSEELDPHALNQIVERYFSTFLDHIHAAHGDINETAGDGIMVIFQETDNGDHAQMAAATALDLFAATKTLNEASELPPLKLHMGLNSGKALVGSTRFEGKQGVRWTFTASGPVTNLAARLAALAEPGEILAGPETVRRLSDRYRLETLGAKRLKNVADDTVVHRLLPLAKT